MFSKGPTPGGRVMKRATCGGLGRLRGMRWILAAALGLGAAGCRDDVDRAAGHREAAEAFLASGEPARAAIELENVVRLDPRDDEAYYRLGEARLALGRFRPAYQAFRRAALLDPGSLEAQLKLGQLNLFAGRLDDALERAQLVLAGSEDHPGGLALLADIRRMEGDLDAAVDLLGRVVSAAPDQSLHRLHLARLHLAGGDLRRADAAFRGAAEVDPDLRPLLAGGKAPYGTQPVLARYHEGRGAWKEAESAYRTAAATASELDVSPLLDLAAYHARRGDTGRALETVERAGALREHDPDVRVHRAEILMHAGDLERAEAEVAGVLKQHEGHVGANLLQGKLLLERRAWAEAGSRFERVVRAKPGFAPGYCYRGLARARQGRLAPALESLEEAARLDPELLRARLLLAELYLEHYEKGYLVRAREHVRAAVRIAPDDLRVLTLLGNLCVREQDLPCAEEAFMRVVRGNPSHARARFRLGVVHHLMGRRDEALDCFRSALERDPAGSSALVLSVQLLLSEDRAGEAVALCRRAASLPGASGRSTAVARYLEGKALLALGDRSAAERRLLSAVELEPDLLPPHVLLTRLYLEERRAPELVSHFEDVLERSPGFLPGYMVLGMLYDRTGRPEEASAVYRKALSVKPDFAPAANNLAWNLAVEEGRLDEAFGLARTAKTGMPEDPHVSDTVGWIYHLLGHHWKAVGELEHAVSERPENPLFSYHLGRVYWEAGEPERAGACLERALGSGQPFPGSGDAKRLLGSVKEWRLESAAAEGTKSP